MIYLNVILTILCLVLLTFLVLSVFIWKKVGKYLTSYLNSMFEARINQPNKNNTTNTVNSDFMANIMKDMLQNMSKK